MGYTRGKPLKPGEKRAIVCVKNYFDINKKDFGVTESSAQLTADALEIGVSTVNRVMADFFGEIQRYWIRLLSQKGVLIMLLIVHMNQPSVILFARPIKMVSMSPHLPYLILLKKLILIAIFTEPH